MSDGRLLTNGAMFSMTKQLVIHTVYKIIIDPTEALAKPACLKAPFYHA